MLHWFYKVNCSEDEYYQAQEIPTLFSEKKNVHKGTYTNFVTKWGENVLKARINELLGSYHILSLWHLASTRERVNETINKKNG